MSEHTFTTHGNEPIEARIVCWVLGEASAFEEAELQRLCDQQPELRIFKRRMEVLHGLLKEAKQLDANKDKRWRLPAAKRKAIEHILGKEIERDRERRVRKSGQRAIWALAACLVITLVVAGLMAPWFMVKKRSFAQEQPMIVSYEPSDAADDAPDNAREKSMVPFRQVARPVPPELIEGTPMPIQLPGLVDPSQSDRMRISEITNSTNAQRESIRRQQPEAKDKVSKKPVAPASSTAKVMGSAAAGGIAIPVPDVDVEMLPVEAPSISLGGKVMPFKSGEKDKKRESGERLDRSAEAEGVDPFAGSFDQAEDIALETTNGPAPAASFYSNVTAGNRWSDKRGGNSSIDALVDAQSGPATAEASAPSAREGDVLRGNLANGKKLLDADRLDEAKRQFESKLRKDPYNTEARRGLERLAKEKSDYTRAAYGDTRAELLMDADQGRKSDSDAKNSKSNKGWRADTPVDGKLSLWTDEESQLGADSETDAFAWNESKPAELSETVSDAQWFDASDASILNDYSQGEIDASLPIENDIVVGHAVIENSSTIPSISIVREITTTEVKERPEASTGETLAAIDPFSTFSLNISDASFRVAQAALARGEQPDPNGIQIEQFYNAVDYGDPAPAAGQPVAGHVEQAAHPVIPGRNLLRMSVKTAAAGRSPNQSLQLTLLVDLSGSMAREDRRQAMDQAIKGLSQLLTSNDVIHVVGFSRTPSLLAEGLNGDRSASLSRMINMDANEGGTNLEEAIKLGEQLAKRHQKQGAQNRMVLFTDGAANLGDADPDSLAAKVKQLRQDGIAFDVAGIAADDLNDELLAELARYGNGRYYVVGKGDQEGDFAKQLAGAFRPAAENVKVQVHFNPSRVASYKLIGFEKDRLNKEDFRNDAVDAAEMAAEEAGVAVYQVDPMMDGSGEIGEMSVRFRDTTTGEMVERTWTIPYDPASPTLERASASMQLAGLATLIGQKLKGGPMADAIDLKKFAKIQAQVRQAYGSSGRTGEMLQMLDALK